MKHAYSASLRVAGADDMAPATRGVALFTAEQLQQVYSAGLQRGQRFIAHSYSATILAMRSAMIAELILFLSHVPPAYVVNVYTMQPVDVVVFMTVAWLPKHGRTVMRTCEVLPAATSIQAVLPAMDYVFAIRGRGGEWSLHTPYNNPCRSQLVQDFSRGAVRYVRLNGPSPVAAHPLERTKVEGLVDSLDVARA